MKSFFKYSALLGSSAALVQGAGGNTSVKTGEKLYVKASGVFLKDVKEKNGFVCSRYGNILKELDKIKKYRTSLEAPFSAALESTLILKESFGRPSIEASLHAAIPSKYVFHTHSVFANVLNFAQSGEKLIKQIFAGHPNLVITYCNPGLELGWTIHKIAKKQKVLPEIIFLKNHGLITCSDNAREAYDLTIDVQNHVVDYLKKQKAYKPFAIKKQPANLSRHLFPDSVVYSQINFKSLTSEKQKVYWEICSVINYTLETLRLLNLQPVFLPAARVKFLKDMEQEKHRINLFIKQ